MFGKPIQPISLPDLATLEENCCMFFHSSTNAILSCVKLLVQIMFIRFDSHDIKKENLGQQDCKTQTGLPQDVDYMF